MRPLKSLGLEGVEWQQLPNGAKCGLAKSMIVRVRMQFYWLVK
jgi:hypothetical protein